MGEQEVTAFLNHLATKANVSASTQNQALSAILFLYKYVLKDELDWLEGLVRPSARSIYPWFSPERRLMPYWTRCGGPQTSWPH